VEMFLSRDPVLARSLAEKLHRLNEERRATEAEALRAIEAEIEAMASSKEGLPSCLVLDDISTGAGTWHRGVIGILASRVVDRTAKPALVITHEKGTAYGSGRSVRGFHLLDALTVVHGETPEPLFARFGGHAHAVGFSLLSEHVPQLRERMQTYADEQHHEVNNRSNVECDAEIRLGEITPEFLTAYEELGPFGNSNPEPVFITMGVRLTTALKVVKERHLRLSIEDASDGVRFGAMAWSRRTDWAAMAQQEGWSQGDLLDLAYRLHRNWHPDFGGWELEVIALRRSAESAQRDT
jgi:single-stranded-DNA-specific exonuclease